MEATESPAFVAAPVDSIAVKNKGIAPSGKEGAETTMRCLWGSHTESRLRVRNRAEIQRVAALHSPPLLDSKFCRCRKPSTPCIGSLLAVKFSLGRL